MKRNIFRIALVICLFLSSFLFSGAVFAQDEALPSPGITPDSPFYFLDKLGKDIGMFFAFGNEAKAKKALKYAEERLSEVRVMMEKNRIREMERAANDYDGYMAMVNERLENAGISDNITATVALAAARHLAVLDNLTDRVPQQAAAAIAHAKEVSINGQVNALRALAKDKPENAIDIASQSVENRMERARIRISGNIISANVTGEALDYAARISALEDEITALAEQKGIDTTAILQRLAQSTSHRLETLSGVYDKAPESARQGIENAIENSVKKYQRALDKLKEKNASGNVTDEETVMNRIQKEIRERLQINASNSSSVNQTREQQETRDQDRNRAHNP